MQLIAVALAACLIGGAALAQTTGTTSQPKDSNAAVQSPTSDTALVPARGANSFTEDQAKSRIEAQGYANVSDLTKDDNGVWRGRVPPGFVRYVVETTVERDITLHGERVTVERRTGRISARAKERVVEVNVLMNNRLCRERRM